MWYRIFANVYRRAAEKMCRDCELFIVRGDSLLDLGCGAGIIAESFRNHFKIKILGVDVIDRRIFPIPFRKIDGKNLPFNNDEFDEVLIAYVLHHSQDPLLLLTEAARVSKKRIIIFEDLPDGLVSKFFCKLHGFSFDSFFGNPSRTSFKNQEEWENIFQRLGLKDVFQKNISLSFDPVKKKMFVLEKITGSQTEGR